MSKSYRSLAPLVAPHLVEKPVDWTASFGRRSPIELEIGCGNGEYLARLAAAHPERDFIGIERMWGRVKKILRKINRLEAGNARLVYGEAGLTLRYLIPPRTLSRVHTLFPCPWPGDEAGRHRLYGPAFLALVNSRLVEDGRVVLVTDDREYFDWVLARLPGSGFAAETSQVGADYGTKFEAKWVGGGQQRFHRLDLRKEAHQAVPLSEEVPVRIHRIDRFDPASFRLRAHRHEDMLVRGRDLLHDPEQRRSLLQVVVVEADLTQELWIEVRPDGEGFRIAPARGCGALMTDGVQLALDAVAKVAGRGSDDGRT